MIVDVPSNVNFTELFKFLIDNPENELISTTDYAIDLASLKSPECFSSGLVLCF